MYNSNIKEQVTSLQRAALLALHTFCLQLQHENHGFIQEFVEGHLALRSAFKAPDRLQPVSLKETEFVCLLTSSPKLHIADSVLNIRCAVAYEMLVRK